MIVLGSHLTVNPEEFLRRTVGSQALIHFPEGHTVYAEGDPADNVFYIMKGSASASVLSKHGKQAIVLLLKDGSFFGEECAAGKTKRTATVTCVLPCTMFRIETPTMIRLLREEPEFATSFIGYLVDRATVAQGDLISHLFNSSEKRLAELLVRLATSEDGRLQLIVPTLSQETLAMMVGTTRSRINCFMNKFRQSGLIDYNGRHIEVREGLLDVLGDGHIE
jgi:CRP-like cAMP-binding protein